MIVLGLACALSLALANPTSYLQCDKRWKDEKIGTSSYSICNKGDLLTVIAMQASGCSIKINNELVNPQNLNTWLTNQGGYSDLNIEYKALEKLNFIYKLDTNKISEVRNKFKYGYYEVAVQSKSNKWYALTNFVIDRLFVIDPMGETSLMMNNEFKYAVVFYNSNC